MPEAEADIRVFNQATMELGATVCAPNGPPRCLECPAMAFCKGRLRGTAEDLPVKGAKKPRRVEEKTVFLLVRDGKIALRKRWTRLPPERRCPSGAWSPGGGRAD